MPELSALELLSAIAKTGSLRAVSIVAEIIARSGGGGGRPLAGVEGRIHHDVTL
jgi:xanthine dehydrogenase accessory factor